jgi:hypothetical protein
MSRGRKSGPGRKGIEPPARVLVFGEDPHDTATLVELAKALEPKSPFVLEGRRQPLVLMRNREAARQKKNAQDLAAEVRRSRKRYPVAAVIAHEDCDDVEPAHV